MVGPVRRPTAGIGQREGSGGGGGGWEPGATLLFLLRRGCSTPMEELARGLFAAPSSPSGSRARPRGAPWRPSAGRSRVPCPGRRRKGPCAGERRAQRPASLCGGEAEQRPREASEACVTVV